MMIEPSLDELEKLKEVLDSIEWDIVTHNGWKHLSGGFCTAEMYDYDDDFFDIEIKEGVQNDVENRVYTSQIRIKRHTLEVEY